MQEKPLFPCNSSMGAAKRLVKTGAEAHLRQMHELNRSFTDVARILTAFSYIIDVALFAPEHQL